MIELENESSSSISGSPDAPFENNTLSKQCGNFATSAMHSTTHPSESNYFAEVSGLNAAINSGDDALARFGLSDCAPDSTSSVCTYGGGHFASTVPSLFSQLEARDGASGWKTYADDMVTPCEKIDDNVYATVGTSKYRKYVTKHNPAVFFNGIACSSQDVPAGDWQNGSGAFYNDVVNGTLPEFSYLQPNDIENGHDPVSVNGTTVAGGKSQVGNIDNFLSKALTLIQTSPDYQSGKLVLMITFDEGTKVGPIAGEDTVGENCADPNISPLATSCQVQTWVVGRYVPSYTYSTYMNQFGLLAATQRILGLRPILGHAADATTPDIVNGTAALPNPFNLAANAAPPAPTPPMPPTGVAAAAGNGQVGLTWSAPQSTGGSALTDYLVEYRQAGAASWSSISRPPSTATSATVAGLANGTAYDFRVSAINAVGSSQPSATVTTTPTATTAELLPDPGFESGLGGWKAFTVGTLARTAAPVHGGASSLNISAVSSAQQLVGMTQNSVVGQSVAGTTYTAQCWAMPTSANLSVQFRWLEYTQNLGSSIHLSTTTVNKLPTGVWTLVKVSSAAVNSAERMVPQVYATNETTATGTIYYDDCSVTAGSGTPAPTAPAAPTAVSATAGDGSATVSFTAPTSMGGSPVTGYTVTATPGGGTVSGAASPLTITGLVNGTGYTFTATATNAIGTSPSSGASSAVTPAGVPAAPASLALVPGNGSVSVSWNAPASNGSPLQRYEVQYSLSGTGVWQTVATGTSLATTVLVTGLTNDASYDFQVAAANTVGEGDFSPIAAAAPTAPHGVPGMPTAVTATAGDGSATVSFVPPAADGTPPVTSYVVTSIPGGLTGLGLTSAPITITGLANGTSYRFTVTASNSDGAGSPSAPSNAITPNAPVTNPELLPDPGFESTLGGWKSFNVGTLTRGSTPVHGGTASLTVTAVSSAAQLVGMTQNSVVGQSVSGTNYTAQCWLWPTSANLSVQFRWLEYTQNLSSSIHLSTTTVNKLPVGAWTLVKVSSAAVNSGERMIPQVYSTNETTATGSIVYDDCSVTTG